MPRLRSHSGTCWISGSTASELRRQQQHRGDQEDAGRVVALVAGRAHDEELRQRDARSEDRELEPVAGRLIELREERRRHGDRDRADDEEVASAFGGSLLRVSPPVLSRSIASSRGMALIVRLCPSCRCLLEPPQLDPAVE